MANPALVSQLLADPQVSNILGAQRTSTIDSQGRLDRGAIRDGGAKPKFIGGLIGAGISLLGGKKKKQGPSGVQLALQQSLGQLRGRQPAVGDRELATGGRAKVIDALQRRVRGGV